MPDIETLDLSVKSYATIKRMGINTTEELKDRIEDVLLHTQKAGEEALEKLNAFSVVSTEQRKQAFELHYRIISSADTAQSALWDMCKNLKEMRDSKLYKALGYKNFEDYCEKEVGMTRRNVYRYISVVENVQLENVTPVSQIGIKKLSLLATLSSEQQTEVAEKVNLEETTYKDLKAEIDKLKQENKAYADRYSNVIKENNKLKNTCLEVAFSRNRLEEENEELRSRPVEVAVVDNSAENDRKLNEVIRSLERENMKRNEEMDRQYIEDRRKLEADKKAEIAALRKEYEKKLSEKTTAEPIDENTQRFESYCLNLYETFDRLIEFVRTHRNINYNEKIGAMIDTFTEMWEDFE